MTPESLVAKNSQFISSSDILLDSVFTESSPVSPVEHMETNGSVVDTEPSKSLFLTYTNPIATNSS